MRKSFLVVMITVLVLALAGTAWAGGWSVKQEGNGLVYTQPGVDEVDLGWNFKLSENGAYIRGNLNIVEKLGAGEIRHFKLEGSAVDPSASGVIFNCATDEVRVHGWGTMKMPGLEDEPVYIAVHLRGASHTHYPQTVWYWVSTEENDASYAITNSGSRLEVHGDPFTTVCPD